MSEVNNQVEAVEVLDFSGEIVEAICEEVTEKHIVACFKTTERVLVPACEWNACEVGSKSIVYIEDKAANGLWNGSVEKTVAARIWYELHMCFKNQTDVEVEVVAAEGNGLICDIKTMLGFMPRREIEVSPAGDLQTYVGRKLKARVVKFSPTDAKIILSHRAAVAEQLQAEREALLAKLQPEQIYDGIVKHVTDFGAFVEIGAGVEGLVHRSNLSWNNDDPANVVSSGDSVKVVVLSVENGKIGLGRKQLISDGWLENVANLKVGDVIEGQVTTFAAFGAFVRVADQVEGLIHNSELSWDSSIHQARQVLNLNDTVKVKIINIDENKRRVGLSLRQVDGNPWQHFADNTPVGTKLNLSIVSIAEFGLFVELGAGLRGLIHKNDVQWAPGNVDLEGMFHVGDSIDCILLSVDVARERASLGIKQLSHDPWQVFLDKKPLGQQFEAVVQRIARFGAFASIEDVEGLIHISELSEKRVENVESVVKVGDTVTVTVVRIDEDKHRIGLSLIAAPFEPEGQAAESSEETEAVESEEGAKMGDIFPEMLKNK